MEREAIKEFVKEVIGPNTEMVDHPRWVGMHCPLAPWTHAKGTDSNPSAGISVKDDDISIFNCYGCHTKGPLPYLLKQLEKYTGENYADLIREIDHDEFLGTSLPEWGANKKRVERVRVLEEDLIELYDPFEEHWYLDDRGIPSEMIQKLGLRLDPEDSEGEERIIFPVRNTKGQLVGFTGRATSEEARLKVRDYHGFKKAHALLGSHLLQGASQVIIAEGLFDYAAGVSAGLPVVAAMHANLTEYQQRIIRDLALPTVLFFDNDDAGKHATSIVKEALRPWVPLSVVKYRTHGGKLKKKWQYNDPGEMPDEELVWMVENARVV
jgi:hypothetical protein